MLCSTLFFTTAHGSDQAHCLEDGMQRRELCDLRSSMFPLRFSKDGDYNSSKVVGAYAPVYELQLIIEFVYVQLEELDMVKGPVLSVEANDDLLTALDIMNSNGRLQRMRFFVNEF